MTTSQMRRRAIYFDNNDRVSGVSVYASPAVVAQLSACLGREVRLDGDGWVTLTVEDAAKSAKWAGGFSAVTSPDYQATTDIYACLTYGVFNSLWDDGVDGALAGEVSY